MTPPVEGDFSTPAGVAAVNAIAAAHPVWFRFAADPSLSGGRFRFTGSTMYVSDQGLGLVVAVLRRQGVDPEAVTFDESALN